MSDEEIGDEEIVERLLPGALLAQTRHADWGVEDDEVAWWQAFQVEDGDWRGYLMVQAGAAAMDADTGLHMWDHAVGRSFGPDRFDDYADHHEGADLEPTAGSLSRVQFAELFDAGRAACATQAAGPQMSAWYECRGIGDRYRAAAMLHGLPLCVVEVDGAATGLALTAGGQDFTWEICEAYMRLGYLPPYQFVVQLSAVGGPPPGRDSDRLVVAGCERTFGAMLGRVAHQREIFVQQSARWFRA